MLLQASNISKTIGATPILSNINLQILPRERIGIVGVNGAGKSTLLKILADQISYDSGQIFKAKETTIGYLAQNSGLESSRSIWQELIQVFAPLLEVEAELRELEQKMADPNAYKDDKEYEQLMSRYAQRSDWFREHGGYEVEANVRGMLHGMGFGEFSPDTPISSLSGGQKTRLALAKLLLQAPDLLMLDEPTNHLDIDTLTWLEGYLRNYSGAIVIVSHDRYFLDALVNTIIEVERHTAKRYTGNYSKFVELKAADYEIQMKHFEKQQDEIAKLQEFVQRNIARASTTKRAQSRRKALERMERMDRPQGELKSASFAFQLDRMSGKDVLKVEQLAVGYSTEEPLMSNLTFHVNRGDTIAFIGPNGIGKSTLLKTLVDELEAISGTYVWGANVSIGYYDQEQGQLNPNHTVLDEVWNAFPHIEEARIRTILGNFLFSGEDVLKKISSLSGGEKARVSLAKLMLLNANVLIFDEPTNHLDLFSKEVLEAALLDYEGTILFISHDRYFLNKMADRVLEMTSEGCYHFLGNYDDYLEKKQELLEIETEQKVKLAAQQPTKSAEDQETGSGASNYEADKQAKREERAKQRKIEQIEEAISALEQELEALQTQLTEPDNLNDYLKLQAIQQDIEAKEQQLTEKLEAWEALMS